jgi:hypothetical protein
MCFRLAAALLLASTLPGVLAAQGSWHVDPVPAFRIAALAPSGETRFTVLTSVTQLGNGDIVVADGGTASLTFLTPAGVVTRRTGRQGAGPGEFEQLWWMGRCGGDSLVVHDLAGRVSIFSPGGTFVRQVAITDPVGIIRCGTSGRLAMLALQPTDPPKHGSFRPSTKLLTTRGKESPRELRRGGPGTEFALLNSMPVPDPLGKQTVVAVLGEDILLGTGDSTVLERLAPDGRRVGTIRWTATRAKATAQGSHDRP